MSREGYHLVNINFATYYTFKKGELKNYTYFINLKETYNLDEYKLMYSDSGLDYIDNSNGYYYFRSESRVETEPDNKK